MVMITMMTKIHFSSAECDDVTAVINDDYSFARCGSITMDSGSVRNVYLRGAIV